MRWPGLALALSLGCTAQAAAQYVDYEALYGPVRDVTVDSLLESPSMYSDKAVRTRGSFEMIPTGNGRQYGLRGTFGGYLYIIPRTEVAAEYESRAMRWVGREVEVTGSIAVGTASSYQQYVMINIWAYLEPLDEKAAKRAISPDATLEDLVTKPERYDGKTVTVSGQFRGQNLYGDLPSASRMRSSDWVIKDDVFAAWVTGKKPKGSGWSLDAGMKRDTGKWLQVTGRVRARGGVVTLEALDVVLTKPPEVRAAEAPKPEPTPPPPPRPPRPLVVVFSLPLDGERDIQPDTQFQIQFARDMNEATFKDHVVLRYAGRPQPGDNPLDAVRMRYDGGLRTLHVDPGDQLRPGRIVEILLLPGIVDLDGHPLEARKGIRAGAAADVLRFQVASPGFAGR
jgi:Bacterial Ig-like domain